MKNRNIVSLRANPTDSFEVYTANITPENHNLQTKNKVPIPTIRLTQATPSDTSVPSIIAPKTSPRKKVVPKKSKLAILSAKAPSTREKDLSDVLRRVNASTTNLESSATCNVTVNGGTTMKKKDLLKSKDRSSRSTIDIYVDPADDPDIGEIVVVKKKKSRAKLDGLFTDKERAGVKEEPKEEMKWWSIKGKKKDRLRNNSLNALKVNITEANTVLSEARPRCGSTPLSPPDSGYADSIALRAMKSIARIGSWAQLKNNNLPRDSHQHAPRPPESRVKSSISSFEVGALSTHTGEDLTHRLSPLASLGHGPPPAQYRFLNPSITNTSVRQRTSSSNTLLSVASPTSYLQPYDNRRLSTSSSSGESNRPGSTYTASGEDTGAWGMPVKASTHKTKKGMSVKWGSVSSALALTKGRKKLEKEKANEVSEVNQLRTTKSNKKSSRTEKATSSNKADKENLKPQDKETRSKKHTMEGRRRTHVMNVFPGLSFGRSTIDIANTAAKKSMPPIAEDNCGSCNAASRETLQKLNKQHEDIVSQEPLSPRNDNFSGISDSESEIWNKDSISDEEACVRLNLKVSKPQQPETAVKFNTASEAGSPPPARPRPRPRPASEQLLGSLQVTKRPRPVGMVVDTDASRIGCLDKEDALSLSVLEAANSDLASLINRLDLEATPDKDRDITTSTYAEAVAAWRVSGSTVTQGVQPVSQTELKEAQPTKLSSHLRCSVFGEKDNHARNDELPKVNLLYRDPIAFLDPTLDLNPDTVGESFAFINSVNGAPAEESPLRRIGKVRAMAQAMGTATGAASATMSRRFSAISTSTRASVTSLRPYGFMTLKNKTSDVKHRINETAAVPVPVSASDAITMPGEKQEHYVPVGQPVIPSSVLNKQSADPSGLAIDTQSVASFYSTDDDSAASTQGLTIPTNDVTSSQASRTCSIASTFGTGAVLARMHKQQLEKLMMASTPITQSCQTADPSSKTFGSKRKPIMFTLPSFESMEGCLSSYASQIGIEDTPTRPAKSRGHVRQSSGLVPISHGISVRRKVQHIEQLTRSEREREEKEKTEIARRGAVKYRVRPSTSSCESHSSDSSCRVSPDERASMLMFASTTGSGFVDEIGRGNLGFEGIASIVNGGNKMTARERNRDIPNELKDLLSANNRSVDGSPPLVRPETPSSAFLSVSTSVNALPPSPGLPPTSPLPIPGCQSFVLPTPTSTHVPSIEIQPSPPAPSLLPFIDPSPSPEAPGSSLPTFTIVPPQDQQSLSEDADVDEPFPRALSRSGLSASGSGSDDDTKQSFDFTGELKRLNESGGSHRRSFVEQLEAAFKTPAHVTFRGGFGIKMTTPVEPTPAIPTLKMELDADMEEGLSMMVESLNESMNNLGIESTCSAETLTPSQLSHEVMSKPSYGCLDTAFKFGGRAQNIPTQLKDMPLDNSIARELPGVAALSTSPSPQFKLNELPCRSSTSIPVSPVEEDSSVLRSIYIHAAANSLTQLVEMPLPNLIDSNQPHQVPSHPSDHESNTNSQGRMDIEAYMEKAKLPTHARQSSDVSFSGFSSFGAIRTKFEFGPDRPDFYTSLEMSQPSIPKSHFRHESLFSIASVSSYGEVIKPGMKDPFNYGDLAMADDEEERDEFRGLDSVLDQKRGKRFSTDSDVSSFYFRPGDRRNHTRNQSVLSTNSVNGPPISLYNRNFNYGHRRNDSGDSMSSVAAAYSIQGANGGRAAWMRHQQGRSVDSVTSEVSAVRLGRPGVGDKMFESIADHYPLTSITASPPESVSGDLAQKSSYDSILDEERRSTVDSIFDNTGHRSSISSESVFWHDPTHDSDQPHEIVSRNLFPPADLFRPLSFVSTGNNATPREDDTMITMLDGGHVRRRSLGSSFEASPCFRVEKQKREFEHDHVKIQTGIDDDGAIDSTSPTAKIGGRLVPLIHKESIASVRSSKFGETRMNLARNGLLHRESLEDSCLSADGEEDFSINSARSKVFSRPAPRHQRKPIVSVTQPPDTTPPLSSSEGSGESQSSIDVEKLKVLLQTAAAGTRSSATRIRSGVRIRAPGQGHRRRISQVSKGSVIGTIQEEIASINGSPRPAVAFETSNDRNKRDSFESNSSYSSEPLRTPLGFEMIQPPTDLSAVSEPHIVEPQEWDEERWVVGLRRYYALRSEASEEISHSRTMWPDTPFSLHALQGFVPPREPAVMHALLEHSQKNYMPLPIDNYPRKVRSSVSSTSRTSPYCRPVSSSGSSVKSTRSHRRSCSRSSMDMSSSSTGGRVLQPKNPSNNSNKVSSPGPTLAAITPFSPFSIDLSYNKNNNTSAEESFLAFAAIDNAAKEQTEPLSVIKPAVRPRVPSATRRTALGWSKRKTPKHEEGRVNNKENEAHGLLISPSESLRIVRPRPRSRVVGKNANVAPYSTALLST